MWSLINVSSNLHTTDAKLTGLLFSGLFLDTFLNSGEMFASFHSEGTIPSSSDKLNTFASGVRIVVSHQLQVIYYLSSFLIFFAIILGVTHNCP